VKQDGGPFSNKRLTFNESLHLLFPLSANVSTGRQFDED
jgi:hypothetical protein